MTTAGVPGEGEQPRSDTDTTLTPGAPGPSGTGELTDAGGDPAAEPASGAPASDDDRG